MNHKTSLKLQAFRKTYSEYRDLLGHDVTEEDILPMLKEEYPNDKNLVQWWFENEIQTPRSPYTMRSHGLFYCNHLSKVR